jgi:hypothetical protein
MEGITMTRITKKPSLEVAHILREHIVDYQQTHCLFPEQYKIVYDMLHCILVGIFNSAIIVAPNVLCIIHAVIVIAPSVRIYHGNGGLRLEKQSFCRLFTFITYLPCPMS